MNDSYQENLQRIRKFRLIDDEFLTKCFESSPESIELVLRILLDKSDLKVVESHTQVFIENLLNRSVRFDVLATDSEGRKFNIEIQRATKGAGRKRARYNSAMMDANLLEKGTDFEALPETYVIFITENDVIGEGEAVYEIERCFIKTGKCFNDGTHILYVNGAYRDDSAIGKLMQDFACDDPSKMHYEVLAERTKFFKETKEGVLIMSQVMEDLVRQARQEGVAEGEVKGRMNTAKLMLSDGSVSFEKIARFTGLSLQDVQNLAAKGSI